MKKRKFKIDWKYIIRETLLIFIGINLAIWFNNWNTNKKSNHNKEVIIAKIKEEIRNNMQELDAARIPNQKIKKAFDAYSVFFCKSSSEIVSTTEQFTKLQQEYPNFFKLTDSIKLNSNKYRYLGDTFIVLEIPEITSIAWETIHTINIANEFDYNCLYELESMYNLQERVQKEIDKAADVLQAGEIQRLFKVLNFIEQLDSQLMKSYDKILESIDDCR